MPPLPSPPIATEAHLLMRQASMTANEYMMNAIVDIDEQLGQGYAKAHPELIGAYMQTAAIDFLATFLARKIEALSTALENEK